MAESLANTAGEIACQRWSWLHSQHSLLCFFSCEASCM